MKPIIFNNKIENFEDFKKRFQISKIIDTYEEQLEDLFLIRNPKYKFINNHQQDFEKFLQEYKREKSFSELGEWVYFPWDKCLTHYLPNDEHQEIRTARNKNLITKQEQDKFYNFKVGIVGLSVGSHAALILAMSGGGRFIKLADPDKISSSNLNRIRYDFTKIGINKCELAAQQIYKINPYAEIDEYANGITDENMAEFLDGIDILIEECDNLLLKIKLRIEAKKRGIPVVMATDNDDNIIVDIERYDLDKNLKIFNGVAGDLTIDEFQKIQPQDLPKLATKIAGPNFITTRMFESVKEVGKTLYSWPQLGTAATLCGVAIAYIVKKIANGNKIKSGKMEINLDSIFDPDYNSLESIKQREDYRNNFLKAIGLK